MREGYWLMPERFYLICERRSDGGLRVSSPEIPGLILSSDDPEAVMRNVVPAIEALTKHNCKGK
jgi:predicted RNase H-like HicB family nuclease